MASVRKTPRGRFELTIRNRLLTRPVYLTFDTESEAKSYGDQVDRLLAAGVVPADLVREKEQPKHTERLHYIIGAWIASGQPAQSDMSVLRLLQNELGRVMIADVTYAWAEAWVRSMKLDQDKNYAPSTIRKRIGSLSRCLDWWLRQAKDVNFGNPLKLLPRGLAAYSSKDSSDVAALNANAKEGGKSIKVRVDVHRERRLLPGEWEKICAALAGERRQDRERALSGEDRPALAMLFSLIVWTGLRLREAYTITRDQVHLDSRKLAIRTSKQWHGRVKWRNVPIRPELLPELTRYMQALPGSDPDQLIFPFWSGDPQELVKTTNRLSARFRTVFEYAGCSGLTEHDLRHEATCRWFEMRDQQGGWLLREVEIPAILGWAPGSKMPQRYASFRAEDLAARMYG